MDRTLSFMLPRLRLGDFSEKALRREVERLHAQGFRAVCLDLPNPESFQSVRAAAAPDYRLGRLDAALDRAGELNMAIWLADGTRENWRAESSQRLRCGLADVFGPSRPLTLDVKPLCAGGTLLAAAALRFQEGELFHEEGVDLTELVTPEGQVSFTLPEGQWRVFVLSGTAPAGAGARKGSGFLLQNLYEPLYERYKDRFGSTLAGFVSGALLPELPVPCPGRRELPWAEELADLLRSRWGQGWRVWLPYLFADTVQMCSCPQARYDYMDCLSRLMLAEHFLPLSDWCRAHGVALTGPAGGSGHWFRAAAGRDVPCVELLPGQYRFGGALQRRCGPAAWDGTYFHFVLGRLAASAGHLRDGQALCLLPDGAGVRDRKRQLEHLLSRGVNVFSAYPLTEKDPEAHWYARLLRYGKNLCRLLDGAAHVPAVAVLYDGEPGWPGGVMPLEKVCRQLQEHQVDFDIVTMDLLREALARQSGPVDGKLALGGLAFDALLVPRADYVPAGLVNFARAAGSFPVLFVGGYPREVLADGCGAPDLNYTRRMPVVSLTETAPALSVLGGERVVPEPAFPQLAVYRCRGPEGQRFLLLNEHPDQAFRGTVYFPCRGHLACYDGFQDRFFAADCIPLRSGVRIRLELEPGECLLLAETAETELPRRRSLREQWDGCGETLDLSRGWRLRLESMGPDGGRTVDMALDALVPVSGLLPDFRGQVRYQREFTLPRLPEEAHFRAERVFDVMDVYVNGQPAGFRLDAPYQVELTGLLQAGENTLTVVTASPLARPEAGTVREPAGMFGKVALRWR